MNKQLTIALLLGAVTLTEAIKVDQKESIPDYWNDYRFHGNKGWADAENPRYADPDQWVATTVEEYPGYAHVIEMTDEEYNYRIQNAGKRGTGFTFPGTNYGLGVKQAQLDGMADYVQLRKEDADPLAAEAEQARQEEKSDAKLGKFYGLGYSKPYQWWQRGDPAEKVEFLTPVISRQHTTFFTQRGEEDPAIFGSNEEP